MDTFLFIGSKNMSFNNTNKSPNAANCSDPVKSIYHPHKLEILQSPTQITVA